jgi:hypothetical protein
MPRTRARTHSSAVTLHAGRILWLMPKEGSGAMGVDDGCYDHPVVVLWADEVMSEAIVLIVSLAPVLVFLVEHISTACVNISKSHDFRRFRFI